MAMSERIRIVALKKHIKLSLLAETINISPQNLSAKLRRDNFSDKELSDIANALGCDYSIVLTDKETGESY